ncbi:hypothetical protein SMACR_04945 [Sordaria macrospora]|uniref:WGS project CABT00000000 data, contig 2.8 n=2 Tax=Sordaria macrospora TaxID=5147 RepID=F7VUJ0_SORMK|nr:uncharacterized protein SMAC_04945 [Sordaria macrospora k-hell]KAA8636288.1 hypothetical protein SMACR_04945 [Sordaria macrospora]WPJ57516.1 hypothetical protein SMAC4_04945 [Sordaria macrospora]CCC09186.1 unnamed protein product [Sordaria macrospora k-hell]
MVLLNERLPSVDHKLKSGTLRASILRTLSRFISISVGTAEMSSRSLSKSHCSTTLRHPNALSMFAPVITIVLFTIIAMANGTALDIKTAFPTIAVLALVTHSANMVMTIVPQAIAACASFDKIEDYIKSQKAPAISHSPRPAQLAEGSEVSIQGLTVQWTPEGSPTLKDINLELLRGQVVACLGPVGAGKSTLARAILGKVPLIKGTIRHRTESIAYCAQVPWLPNRTIRQVICGSMVKYNVGNEWYRAVIRSCCLDQDLAVLPDGDQTVAGADGMNLSGGQRQRVALARAVFHRCNMVVLDDPFSALDGKTGDQVAQNLLGPKGVFRQLNAAVFWITSSRYYFFNAGPLNILLMVTCTASYSFFITFPQYWVKWWMQNDELNTASKRGTVFYALGYALLYLMAWISTNSTMLSTVFRIAPTSGLALHRTLLRTIMHAPLLYFSTADTGVLLNYFSQDIQLVDKTLESAPIMAVTLPICAVIVYGIQKVYLCTSRQLRLLELESRAAVNSSLLETVQGIETIRAFSWQTESVLENVHVVDLSQRAFYILLCLQRWLNVVLDLLIAGVAISTIFLAVSLKGTVTGGQVGVALSVIIAANATLLSLVQSWTNSEISLGAISRLKSVEKDTPEELASISLPGSIDRPFTGWPSPYPYHNNPKLIRFEGISASNTSNGPLVFQDFNLEVAAGHPRYSPLPPPALSTGHLQLLSLARAIIKARRMRVAAQAASDQEYGDRRDMTGGPDPISYCSSAPGFRHPNIVQPIILLDEITASLDEKTERKVLEVIRKEWVENKYIVLMVMHRLEAVRKTLLRGNGRVGDLVVNMEGGKVVGIEKVGDEQR